jgi:hypothetical protein
MGNRCGSRHDDSGIARPLALLRRGIVTPGAVESLAHHLDGALTGIMLAQPTPRDGWNAASVWREERRKW